MGRNGEKQKKQKKKKELSYNKINALGGDVLRNRERNEVPTRASRWLTGHTHEDGRCLAGTAERGKNRSPVCSQGKKKKRKNGSRSRFGGGQDRTRATQGKGPRLAESGRREDEGGNPARIGRVRIIG